MRSPQFQQKFEFSDQDSLATIVKPLSVGLGLGALKAKSAVIQSTIPAPLEIPRVPVHHYKQSVPKKSSNNLFPTKFLSQHFLLMTVLVFLIAATGLSSLVMVTLLLKVPPHDSIALTLQVFSATFSIRGQHFSYRWICGGAIVTFYYLVSMIVLKRKS